MLRHLLLTSASLVTTTGILSSLIERSPSPDVEPLTVSIRSNLNFPLMSSQLQNLHKSLCQQALAAVTPQLK
jgi:hypothetical protein